MKRNGTMIWRVICLVFLFLSACGSQEAEPTISAVTETTALIQESATATITPSSTPRSLPSFTPLPSFTSTSTETPVDLYTPTFTSTPTPTTSPLELTQVAALALTPSPTMLPTSTPITLSQPDYLTLITQFGGFTGAVAVNGHTAYLGVGSRLFVLDISNPSQPQLVSQSGSLTSIIQLISVRDSNIFIVTLDNYLHILNISDNGALQEMSSFRPESVLNQSIGYWDIESVEQTVYILYGGYTSLLSVIDITDLMQPFEVVGYDLPRNVTEIVVGGDYLYAPSSWEGLYIINIADSASPIDVAHFPGKFSSIAIQGTVAYLAAGEAGMRILDISDPANPVSRGVYQTDSMPVNKVLLEGNLLYLIDHYSTRGTSYIFYQYGPPALSGTVQVVDITNPTLPTEVSSFVTPAEIWAITVKENKAFLATGSLRIFDLTSPGTPTEVGMYEIPGEVWDVAVRGNLAYLAGGVEGLYVVDVTAPTAPNFVSTSETFSGHALHLLSVGERLYLTNNFHVAYYDDPNEQFMGIRIFDTSDPANPIEQSVYNVSDSSFGMSDFTAVSSTLYVLRTGSLQLLDMSDPAAPVEISDIDFDNSMHSMAIDGNYIFLTSHSGLLHILDISDPENPHEISVGFDGVETLMAQYEPYISIHMDQIVVINGFAYVECVGSVGDGTWSDLCVIDVREPTSPKFVSVYKFSSAFRDLVAANGYIYLTTLGRLVVFDPTDPTALDWVDTIYLGNPHGLEVVGPYIYVAIGAGGLAVLQAAAN